MHNTHIKSNKICSQSTVNIDSKKSRRKNLECLWSGKLSSELGSVANLHLQGPSKAKMHQMQQWHESQVTWDATFPNQGSRTLKWDGGKKARYCLSTVSFFLALRFLFPGDLSDNGIQNWLTLLAYLHSLLDFTLSVKLYLVKCKGGRSSKAIWKSCWPEPWAERSFQPCKGQPTNSPNNTLSKLRRLMKKREKTPNCFNWPSFFLLVTAMDQWNAQFGGQAPRWLADSKRSLSCETNKDTLPWRFVFPVHLDSHHPQGLTIRAK